jgi:hypothetical protein
LRRRERAAGAVARAAEIIDDDLRAAARQPEGMRAAQTVPAPVTMATRPSNLIVMI